MELYKLGIVLIPTIALFAYQVRDWLVERRNKAILTHWDYEANIPTRVPGDTDNKSFSGNDNITRCGKGL